MKEFIFWIMLIGMTVFGIKSCVDSDWNKAHEAASDARDRAAATPHVIRKADGCNVYAFSADGNEHYFTRCEATTTTERSYTQSCGKACTEHKSEVIVTQTGAKP